MSETLGYNHNSLPDSGSKPKVTFAIAYFMNTKRDLVCFSPGALCHQCTLTLSPTQTLLTGLDSIPWIPFISDH